ncbi:unnamed protein product [Peronospora belbahrii]|uniref:BCNT-C domain-containing protein n=1 Tax=Peronospora belbahrii TaxID=622444 RepID=A0AAU9LQB2_9STRA|nr:unnamed protein product [Peronospora belbahrii]CAH0515836.1 unnamed protein product [Peronospora belbahrii]
MTSSSDEDDGDYFFEDVNDKEEDNDTHDVKPDKPQSVTINPYVHTLWADINVSTRVSEKAVNKAEKLLGSLNAKTKRSTNRINGGKEKRKVLEFSMPILGVDVKKSRRDMVEVTTSKDKLDRVVKFAGKEYSVSTSAARPTKGEKGLDKVLETLVEPKKVSTIEKSSLDWDKFKEKEGIEEELTQYTKDGYVEKQEFLQRLDLKRFEIEKAEREKQRKLQQQQLK